MASTKGVLKLLARISRVFAATVKHAVMFFKRISVAVDWGGISVVGHRAQKMSVFMPHGPENV
jgi:hypothetical protein